MSNYYSPGCAGMSWPQATGTENLMYCSSCMVFYSGSHLCLKPVTWVNVGIDVKAELEKINITLEKILKLLEMEK
jgi:hypothetical protein